MTEPTAFNRLSARAARVPKGRLLLVGAFVLLFVAGAGIGRWQRAAHRAGSVSTTSTLAPASGEAAAQPVRVISDCPCAIPALGGEPLEAFPNGCPCDVVVAAGGAPASEWPASTRLEEFPQGCPCLPATVLPTAVPASH